MTSDEGGLSARLHINTIGRCKIPLSEMLEQHV